MHTIKTYTKLQIPKTSAWDRKNSWKRFVPWQIIDFFRSVKSLFVWFKPIWKDRNWDDNYILRILQHKIYIQRNAIIKANRYVGIERENFWMTVVLNLIEREIDEYYIMEPYEYMKQKLDFISIPDKPELYEMKTTIIEENLDNYLNKYRHVVNKINKQLFKEGKSLMYQVTVEEKENLARKVAHINQEKCHRLLYNILERYISYWWD